MSDTTRADAAAEGLTDLRLSEVRCQVEAQMDRGGASVMLLTGCGHPAFRVSEMLALLDMLDAARAAAPAPPAADGGEAARALRQIAAQPPEMCPWCGGRLARRPAFGDDSWRQNAEVVHLETCAAAIARRATDAGGG